MTKIKGPMPELIERSRPEAEIRNLHKMMYKHVKNPPETEDEMVERLGDRPVACYWEAALTRE